jgi:hypothetical protein
MSTQSNPHLLVRLEGIRQALLAHHSGGATLPNAVKGSERETFVADFLEELFPSPFRFGSGAVTDETGACSGQLDIVVEYPFFPSFPMPGGELRLYLAESVAVAIEVKSNVSSQWSQVEHSVQQLRAVNRKWKGSTQLIGGGIVFGAASSTPVPYIAVGYKGFASLESLKERLDKTDPTVRPDAVLTIESGVFVGPGAQAFGAVGLFGLAAVLTNMFRAASSADVDLGAYVAAHVE